MNIYPESTKICTGCDTPKSLDLFYPKHKSCKECYKGRQKIWRQANKHKIKRYESSAERKSTQSWRHIFRKYGLTKEQWNELLLAQNSCCKICKEHYSKLSSILCVDHCHTTGKIRGLLCRECNKGLGNFKDSEQFLLNAIEYLKK